MRSLMQAICFSYCLIAQVSGLETTDNLYVIEAGTGSPTLIVGGTLSCPTLTLQSPGSALANSYYELIAGSGQWQARANNPSAHVFTASAGPGYASTNIGLSDPANPATGVTMVPFPGSARYYPLKGIKVSGSFPLVTSESGTTATFTVRLNSQPSANVVLNLTSSNLAEGRFVDPMTLATVTNLQLTFTAANWNTNQTVTVKGIDDAVIDGTQPYTVQIAADASTADPGFLSLVPYPISASNTDNDVAGLAVTHSGPIITTEAGGSDSFGVTLNTQPTGTVTVGVTSTMPSEGTVSPATLTFTAANWNNAAAHTVTVTGQDDTTIDGARSYTVNLAVTSAPSDASYLGVALTPAVINLDNEVLGVAPAWGVPGLAGPPNWFDSSDPVNWPIRPGTDDPRWRGALSLTDGLGSASEHLECKALHQSMGTQKDLYLGWDVKVVPSFTVGSAIYLGLSTQVAGADYYLITITTLSVPASSPSNSAANRSVTMAKFHADGTSAGASVTPTWAAQAYLWVQGASNSQWAVHLRVPLHAIESGVDLGSDIKLWYQVDTVLPASTLSRYTWPRDNAAFEFGGAAPSPTLWSKFHLSSGPGDPAASNAGVSLAWDAIGTDQVPDSQITRNVVNTLHAQPLNNTGALINHLFAAGQPGPIHARFRLARWGSQPWSTSSWDDIPGGSDVVQAADIANAASGNLSFTWTPPTGFLSGYDHQCMLVELSGPNLIFLNNSVTRNMDFAGASLFTRAAEISVKGLADQPVITPTRDVYLYIETSHMPSVVPSGRIEPGKPVMRRLPPPVIPPANEVEKNDGALTSKTGKAADGGPTYGAGEPQPLIVGGKQVTDTTPTYIVHAFHDTGRTVTIDGVTRKILHPQSSFGYYISHDGELEGWRYGLENAQLIAPNYYRLSVPRNGSAQVRTVIEALEPRPNTLWISAGIDVPHGALAAGYDGGYDLGAALERRVTREVSALVEVDYHRFRDGGAGNELGVLRFAAGGKYYLLDEAWRPFVTLEAGIDRLHPGTTKAEVEGGLGLQYDFAPEWAIAACYGFHRVLGSASASFSDVRLGIGYRF